MTIAEDVWRNRLSEDAYRVMREKGTERAFTGAYHDFKDPGTYACAGCGQILFGADAKFDSGTGWPSFSAPANDTAVAEDLDTGLGMHRTEVHCGNCGGHLGHVFPDGPAPTGLRYCVNSISLQHVPQGSGD